MVMARKLMCKMIVAFCVQVLLVAGDTFRAAAAEQLAGWAERSRAELAAATSQKQRPDALMYSAIDRVRHLARSHRTWATSLHMLGSIIS